MIKEYSLKDGKEKKSPLIRGDLEGCQVQSKNLEIHPLNPPLLGGSFSPVLIYMRK